MLFVARREEQLLARWEYGDAFVAYQVEGALMSFCLFLPKYGLGFGVQCPAQIKRGFRAQTEGHLTLTLGLQFFLRLLLFWTCRPSLTYRVQPNLT